VVDKFRESGVNFLAPELNPADPKPLDDDTFVDISHESLIRQWSKLSEWLEKEARAAHLWRRLRDRLADGDLLQGRELAALIAWKEEMRPNAEWAKRYGGNFDGAMTFLERSQRAEQDRIEAAKRAEEERLAARQRAEHERRRRRIAAAVAVVVALGVFLGGFSVFFVIQNKKLHDINSRLENAVKDSEKQKSKAEEATKQAEAARKQALEAEAEAKKALADKKAAEDEAARTRIDAQRNIADAAKGLGLRPTATYADETKSFGVAPPSAPVQKLNGPTPSDLPSGKILTTAQLWDAIAHNALGSAIFLVDVGNDLHSQTIPGASRLPAAGQGTMNPTTLQSIWDALSKLTGGNFDIPVVFFGADVKDWSGYNAGLRAANMGYDRVYWYRGGIAAWKAAQQPLK